MFDAKPLLFVHDHQAQIFELDFVGQQPVGSDDHVDAAIGQTLNRFTRFFGFLEA